MQREVLNNDATLLEHFNVQLFTESRLEDVVDLAGVELLEEVFCEALEVCGRVVVTQPGLHELDLCLDVQKPVFDEQDNKVRQFIVVHCKVCLRDRHLCEHFVIKPAFFKQMQELKLEEI